jgi:hypothetical protein
MPYTAPHNYLQVFGTHGSEGDSETWSFGLRLGEGDTLLGAGPGPIPQIGTDDAIDDIAGDLQAFFSTINGYLPSSVRWHGFKFNAVDVQGRYINQGETFAWYRPIPQPMNASSSLPPQCSAAVTFRTAVSRGLASTGRIFLPPLAATAVDENGRLTDSVRDGIANATATLLTNLGNWDGLDDGADYGRVCVMSKVGAGATRRVNRVDVGDVVDTMRSRTSSYREQRSPEIAVAS